MQHSADDLIASHRFRIPAIARIVRRRIDFTIELEDVIAAGYVGLVQAAQTFDPAKHVQFWTWGHWRVVGSMMDYARKERGRAKYSDGKPGKQKHVYIPLEDVSEPATTMLIEEAIERRELRELLRAAVAALPHERQRFVISQRLQGRTNVEIAHELRVTRNAVDQCVARAIINIRSHMEETLCRTIPLTTRSNGSSIHPLKT